MSTLPEIATQLKAPFAFDDIDLLPKGKVERDGKTLCMALPYADPRVYQDRLNAVAYGEWSTPAPVVVAVGNKLVCYVTVMLCGVPHADVGEADAGENQGTEAWAQAFKRACSQFGLGRYLYDLEKEWVPFNPQKKQIELDNAGKRAIVKKMYQKAGIAAPAVSAVVSSNGRQATHPDVPATDQQLASIRKLNQHLGKPEFENEQQIGYLEAKAMIEQLSKEYREAREKQKPLHNGDNSVAKPAQHTLMDVKEFFLKYFKPGQWRGFKSAEVGPVEDEALTDDELDILYKRLLVIDEDQKRRAGAQVAAAN